MPTNANNTPLNDKNITLKYKTLCEHLDRYSGGIFLSIDNKARTVIARSFSSKGLPPDTWGFIIRRPDALKLKGACKKQDMTMDVVKWSARPERAVIRWKGGQMEVDLHLTYE